MLTPEYDEVHISVTFNEDRQKASRLAHEWKTRGPVRIGGPAFGDPGGEFVPGMYLRDGVTITSRGCPFDCRWCFVPKREGKIRELVVRPGNIIQDNNLLACSKGHIEKVFNMLAGQRAIRFSGGLDAKLLTDWEVARLAELKISELWLAYDDIAARKYIKWAGGMLRQHFKRDKLRCYVLIGYGNDTLGAAEGRLRETWGFGFLPFAMLYQAGPRGKEWRALQRQWTRPAITKSIMKNKEFERATDGNSTDK